jgi:hypothetical protein
MRHEVRRNAAMEARVAVEIAGRVVGKDRLEVRRLLLGGKKLGAAHVGDAAHADVAIAPRLLRHPFDDVVEVPLLLSAEQVVVAFRIVAAPHVDDHVRVAPRHPEFGDSGLVLAERYHAALELPRVNGGRDERRKLCSPCRGTDHVRGESDAVAHGDACLIVSACRVARFGAFGRARRLVERILRVNQRVYAADTIRIYGHAMTPQKGRYKRLVDRV